METKTKISTQNLNLYYGENHALKDVSLDLYENKITAFIGPSGCGKSTYLKTLNRMNDLVPGVKIEGSVRLDDEDIYDSQVDTTLLRKKIGMVFQQPNPFPMSIYDNVAYGPRIHGIKNKARRCGMRCRTASRSRPWACPGGSSSVCALQGRWQWNRRYF